MAFMGSRVFDLNMANSHHYSLIYYDERFGGETPRMDCIPALFIPGNGGSAMQMRSIASRSQELATTCIAWYGVRLNEELSALNPHLIYAQAAHVSTVIKWLRQRHPRAPELLLVGHSMGALVARLSNLHSWPQVTLLALASPLRHPILPFDWHARSLYNFKNNLTIYSVGGGQSDVQVHPSDQLDPLIQTTRLAGAWSDPDHQAIVWSHAVVRALVDLIHSLLTLSNRHEVFEKYRK